MLLNKFINLLTKNYKAKFIILMVTYFKKEHKNDDYEYR